MLLLYLRCLRWNFKLNSILRAAVNSVFLVSGFLVDYISIPVTSGFQTATSLIIVVSQMKGILGVKFKSSGFIDNLRQLVLHLKDTKLSADFALGISCIIFLLLMRVI